MRPFRTPAGLLYATALLVTATSASPVQAEPPAIDGDLSQVHNATLVARCDYPCGYSGQLCCPGPGLCYTNALTQAACADSPATITEASSPTTAAGNGGYWETYTSTWVETGLVTRTSVYSSFVGVTAAATPTSGPQCDYAAGQSLCDTICCASGQYCAVAGQCADAGNGGYTTTGIGGTYSPPLRPTTGTFVTSTATVSPTTTVPFVAPVATGANVTTTSVQESGGGGGGLSGGAIAGIVIGVLLGLALLALLCFCCIVRGLWNVFAGIFGRGRRKKTVVEETYVSEHHGSGGGAAGGGRAWYGDKPARPDREKKSRFGGWGAVAAGLGALGLGLAGKRALDRRRDRRDRRSEVSSDYYYSDYYYSDSSPSSASSGDRRTRRSSRR